MSTSWTAEPPGALATLRAWRRQRCPHALFVPVAATLTLASLVATPWPAAPELALRLGLAWTLVLALRLWDDLEDRERDAVTHPERVLTQVTRLGPFMALVAGALLAMIPIIHVLIGPASAVAACILCVGLGALYRLRAQERATGPLLLLLKYPALALILRGALDVDGVLAAALVYGGVCLDEGLQGLGGSTAAVTHGVVIILGATLFLGAGGALLWRLPPSASGPALLHAGLLAAAAALVVHALVQSRARAARAKATRGALMALAFLQLLSFDWSHA